VPTFVHQSEKVDGFAIYFVVEIKRKWLCATARKTVRPQMIASALFDYFSNLSSNAVPKGRCETWGDFFISLF
jgi:hypothetical protein